MKLLIYIFMLLISIAAVNAVMVEKPLNISIANCYNVSIYANLNDGKETDVQFKGCNKIDNEHFFCKCINVDNNNFTIVMKTDNYPVHDLREYDIDITATYFDLKHKDITVPVTDGGDYYEKDSSKWTNVGDDYKIIEKIIYVNNTVYQDREVIVPQDKIVYQDREVIVNKIEYVNNITAINELKKSISTKNNYIMILIIVVVATYGMLIYRNYIMGGRIK